MNLICEEDRLEEIFVFDSLAVVVVVECCNYHDVDNYLLVSTAIFG